MLFLLSLKRKNKKSKILFFCMFAKYAMGHYTVHCVAWMSLTLLRGHITEAEKGVDFTFETAIFLSCYLLAGQAKLWEPKLTLFSFLANESCDFWMTLKWLDNFSKSNEYRSRIVQGWNWVSKSIELILYLETHVCIEGLPIMQILVFKKIALWKKFVFCNISNN